MKKWDPAADTLTQTQIHADTNGCITSHFLLLHLLLPSWASWVSNVLAFSQDSLVYWSWPASLMLGHCGPGGGVKYFKCDLRV